MKHLMFAMVLGLVLLGTGCPDGTSSAVTESCTSAGERCKIADGKLGVCTYSDDQLICAPQH